MISGGLGRLKLVVVLIAVVALLAPSFGQAETLDELLERQRRLQDELKRKEQLLKQKRNEQANLEGDIDELEGSISLTLTRIQDTEEEITITTAVIAKLTDEATVQQHQLETLNSRLRNSYIGLYELSRTSSAERLAQGDSVSDVVSHAMYVQAVQDQLQSDITKSSAILTDLNTKKVQSEQQKQGLDALKSRLAGDKTYLDRQRGQKETYLAATRRDQTKLQEDLKKLEQQREQLSDDIYEARRRMGGGSTGGTGGYPYYNQCGGVDPWLFYKCQCTSYAAWAFLRETGLVFFNTRPGQGSAWNWPALAQDQGYTVSNTPRVGDIVSWPKGANMPYGHVAMVRRVNGGLIDVEEYNWIAPEAYSYRTNINPNAYGTPRYIRP